MFFLSFASFPPNFLQSSCSRMRLVSIGASVVRHLRPSNSPNGARIKSSNYKLKEIMACLFCNKYCLGCVELFKWTPVLFILAVVAWSYYAYVFVLCLSALSNVPQIVLYIVGYHVTLVMFLWAYYKVCTTASDPIPSTFFLKKEEWQSYLETDGNGQQKLLASVIQSRPLPVLTRSLDGKIRFCDICGCIKPDRAHHCSLCRKCILKLDHHCPWVNNCVHWNNYKFFMLFLIYALLFCLYCAGTVFPYFLAFWANGLDVHNAEKFQILFIFFVGIMFSISISFLLCYHLYLVSRNRSTLEAFRAPMFENGPDKHAYNLGCCLNCKQVFGELHFHWPWPFQTQPGNGIEYPMRPTALAKCETGGGGPYKSLEETKLFSQTPENRSRDGDVHEDTALTIGNAVSAVNDKFSPAGMKPPSGLNHKVVYVNEKI